MAEDLVQRTRVFPTASDFELALSHLNGVYGARVILDRNQEICEIHLTTSNARKPKQFIRDVETLLFVKHGVKVDFRMISVVQLAPEDLNRLPMARPEIRTVIEDTLGDKRRIRVTIHGAGRDATGEAEERVDNPTPFATAARATIDAIQKLVGRCVDVRLDQTATMRLDSREVLMVLVSCEFSDHEETFVGAGFVGSQFAESAARATLDALNRRILTLFS